MPTSAQISLKRVPHDQQIFKDWDECVAGLKAAREAYVSALLCHRTSVEILRPYRPHAVMIGSPAAFHGSTEPGADMELQVLKAFPNAALFVEKVRRAEMVSDFPDASFVDSTNSQFQHHQSQPVWISPKSSKIDEQSVP